MSQETTIPTEKTTTKERYEELLAAKRKLDKEFSDYAKLYKKEHEIKGRTIIKEIIELHLQGLTKAQIIEKGYNKGTVNRQVTLFVKGKKVEKTTVRKYITKNKESK